MEELPAGLKLSPAFISHPSTEELEDSDISPIPTNHPHIRLISNTIPTETLLLGSKSLLGEGSEGFLQVLHLFE